MHINEAEKGRKVIYTPFKNCSPNQKEEGIIISKNDKYVFVRYNNDVNSKATRPEDIEYV